MSSNGQKPKGKQLISSRHHSNFLNNWKDTISVVAVATIRKPFDLIISHLFPKKWARDQFITEEATKRAGLIAYEAAVFRSLQARKSKMRNRCQRGLLKYWNVLKSTNKRGPDAAIAAALGQFVGLEARTPSNSENLFRDFEVVGGATPLLLAIHAGRLDVVQSLLDRGANACVQDSVGRTPLHCAADASNRLGPPLIQVLTKTLNDPSWLNASNMMGETPLHNAAKKPLDTPAMHRWSTSAKLLLDQGASVNIRSIHGNTPLHIAAGWESLQCARLLLDCGADTSAMNAASNAPLQLAGDLTHSTLLAEMSLNGTEPKELLAFWQEIAYYADE